ncbi:MAG TPA: malonyl-[acyl-carrier protein] O-methyltransferase BioC [Spirochaetia bacterium]|nr:MAG: malonyl-[acyl-carrier protein] O-methyltransferase BioC [Spirochaetes bacterium GWB1_36_13]HCL57191.1 malonyl-[acyl-carrier protein] O-methyltransferase BioC [Spirochaetia bacterium]
MSEKLNKKRIRDRFRKSLATYHQNALVQNDMAEELVKMVQTKSRDFNKIFEIGAGTGLLTRKLIESFSFQKFLTNDIIEGCRDSLLRLDHRIEFLAGDAEKLDLEEKFDFIISNAVFQWLDNLKYFLERMADWLAPGGILAFTTFGPENFHEIASITGKKLSYPYADEIKTWADPEYRLLGFQKEVKILSFKNPMEVLRHIRLTGVNGNSKTVWNRLDFNHFISKYNSLFQKNGEVRLTYVPYYFVFQKKGVE